MHLAANSEPNSVRQHLFLAQQRADAVPNSGFLTPRMVCCGKNDTWPSNVQTMGRTLAESVQFSLIESVICLFADSSMKIYFLWLNQLIFTDSSVEKYFSRLNQIIFIGVISEIWLILSNLFLAIWISQISLIISRFWLIQVRE